MKFILWLLLLLVFIPTECFATTSVTLSEIRTDTPTGYTIAYYDNDIPTLATDKGYASIERVVDETHIVEERYFDEYNQPITVSGYDKKQNVYDGDKLVRIEYYKDEKLVKNSSGYAIVARTVDDKNHVVQELYYDENEKPVRLTGGQYGMRRDEFDDHDRVIRYTYLGADGQTTDLTSGYSSVYRTYDEVGRSKMEMYFTTNGEPAVLSLGHSGSQYIRDSETGKHIGTIYLDVSGTPMINNQGYSVIRYDYDEWNNIAKYSYYDLEGNPVPLSRGQYGQVIEYDRRTRVRSYYVDADGNEMFLLDQYLAANPVIVFLSVILLIALTVFFPRRFRSILLVLYAIFILYMTLFVRESGDQRLNLNLFWSYRQVFSDPVLGREVLNNILLFIPLGALLYSINPKLLWIAPVLTILIESTQYIGGFGLAELDDVFGNSMGAVSGWLLMRGLSGIIGKYRQIFNGVEL